MIPFFSGIGTGVGIVSKRTGIGIAWNRFQSGIDSRAGIGSMAGIDSKYEKTPVYKYKYEIIFLAIIITNCLKINRILINVPFYGLYLRKGIGNTISTSNKESRSAEFNRWRHVSAKPAQAKFRADSLALLTERIRGWVK